LALPSVRHTCHLQQRTLIAATATLCCYTPAFTSTNFMVGRRRYPGREHRRLAFTPPATPPTGPLSVYPRTASSPRGTSLTSRFCAYAAHRAFSHYGLPFAPRHSWFGTLSPTPAISPYCLPRVPAENAHAYAVNSTPALHQTFYSAYHFAANATAPPAVLGGAHERHRGQAG